MHCSRETHFYFRLNNVLGPITLTGGNLAGQGKPCESGHRMRTAGAPIPTYHRTTLGCCASGMRLASGVLPNIDLERLQQWNRRGSLRSSHLYSTDPKHRQSSVVHRRIRRDLAARCFGIWNLFLVQAK